jgi:F-box protein 9
LSIYVTLRSFAARIYKPPQIPPGLSLDEVADGYGSDYRRLFVEHPRLRLDGVYIAVCHYMCVAVLTPRSRHLTPPYSRPGLSENAWVNISHLITYRRYL